MNEQTRTTMQAETMQFTPRTLILGITSFVVITLVMIGLIEFIGLEEIQAYIAQAGPWAPVTYILIKAATYVFAPLSSGPIQLSSGVMFNLGPAVLYTMIGEVLGGTLSFLMARYLGRPVVRRFVGAEGIQRVDTFVGRLGGWRALIYARLFLAAIYDFVSYAAGLTRTISVWHYLAVSSTVGLIPTTLFVAAGTSLAGDRNLLLVIYAIIGLMSLVPLLFARFRRRALQS
jgi:uncharacterized membrane protein YdjX (TVP38/TMEM64 family)